jgi:GYF domain 2
MQENGTAAGKSEPSWYLARGDQQWGPLADRELLLLAERGGLKTDDLLWKPGFETWQPVRSVGDFLPSTPATQAEAAVSSATPKPSLKARLYHELKSFLIMFSYLWLVFFVFLAHEWSVLASHQIGFRFYGLAVVNALVLSKIMLIAEALHFAERFKDRPLIYPIAFKSIAFTVLLVVAYIVEEIAVGLFHGKTVAESFPEIGGGGVMGVLTIGAIMCIALVPFFSFREIARAIGQAEFRAMMLGPVRERQGSADPLPQPAHP